MSKNITSRVSDKFEARVLTAMAIELREEMRHEKFAVGSSRAWNPFVKMLKKALIKSGNMIYKKFVEPNLDEIYDDEIEEDVEEWCKDNQVKPCDESKVPNDVLVDIVDDVKDELKDSLSRRYFMTAFKKVVSTLNPVNIIKSAYFAIKKHGMKIGLKVAVIIIIGDLIIPGLGAYLHPSLIAILSLTPHTEIAIAALAVSEGMEKNELLEWVDYYEKTTGEDLVKGKAFG
jgi:hypothetical protein